MSLVRFFTYGNSHWDLRLIKFRHCYDLHQLLRLDEIIGFFGGKIWSDAKEVAQDDVEKGYKIKQPMASHSVLKKALYLRKLMTSWMPWKSAYWEAFRIWYMVSYLTKKGHFWNYKQNSQSELQNFCLGRSTQTRYTWWIHRIPTRTSFISLLKRRAIIMVNA